MLQCSCPDLNDKEAIAARGFDPLLANLLYLYGTALLYTYTQSSDMFGDKAEDEVERRAVEMSAEKDDAVEAILDQLMGPRPDGDFDVEGEEGEEFDEEEGVAGLTELAVGEEEEIDAEKESSRQAASSSHKKVDKEVEEEEDSIGKRKSELNAVEGEKGDAKVEGAVAASGDDEEDAEAGDEQEQQEEVGGGENDGAEEPKEEEMNDLELAWQVLEISRFMYSSQSDHALELSDVHFSLGNVAWEDEKQDEAKSEFDKALLYAEQAKDRRAQAQVLLMLSSTYETKGQSEEAVKALERSKQLLRDEITKIRATSPKDVAIEILESSIKEMDDRIYALNDKFMPVHPDDVKDLPDPTKGPVTFSFTAPTIKSSSGNANDNEQEQAAEEGAAAVAPVTVLQPKKKAKPSAAVPVTTSTTTMTEHQESESRGQKRAAEDSFQDQEQLEPQVKRVKQ